MKRIALVGLLFIGLVSSSKAAPPQQLWQLTGFANPESALADVKASVIYVSNIDGAPDAKDANGYVSKVSLDGKMIAAKWATGMNAPKGLALANGKLYAADIDELIEIDTKDGKVVNRYPAKDAKFLNDVAAGPDGAVYVSDTFANTIWRFADGKFEVWLTDTRLESPNGLLVEGDELRVAGFGTLPDRKNGTAAVPGHLLSVNLKTKAISALPNHAFAGQLDGLEPLSRDTYIVTDWLAGKVMRDGKDGKVETLLELSQGSADAGYDPASKTFYVPQMLKNTLSAYKLE